MAAGKEDGKPSHRAKLGCLVLLFLFAVGCPVAIYEGAFCLFVPCDREVTIVVEGAAERPEGCSLWLFDQEPGAAAKPRRKLEIESGEAGLLTGVWTADYWISLRCPGRPPTPAQRVVFDRHEPTVHLRFAPPVKRGSPLTAPP